MVINQTQTDDRIDREKTVLILLNVYDFWLICLNNHF